MQSSTTTAAPRTLGDLLPLAIDHLWRDQKAAATSIGNARDVVTTLGPETTIADAGTKMAVVALTSALTARGLAAGTVNRKLSALSGLLRFAQDLGELEALPPIRWQRTPAGRTRFLTRAEEQTFIALIEDRAVRLLCEFLVETGLRRSEALALEWRDVEEAGTVVAVRQSKNGKARRVPLTVLAQSVLRDRRDYARPFGLKPDRLTHYWNKARDRYQGDTTELVPHILRHTCASRLVQRGVPLKVVQEWMGHSNIQTTMRYAHVRDEDLTAAARALEAE